MPVPPLRLGPVVRGREKRETRDWESSYFSKKGPRSGFLPRLALSFSLQLCRSGPLAGKLHFWGSRLPSYLREPWFTFLYLISAQGIGDGFHLRHLKRLLRANSTPPKTDWGDSSGLPILGSTLHFLPPPAQVERGGCCTVWEQRVRWPLQLSQDKTAFPQIWPKPILTWDVLEE